MGDHRGAATPLRAASAEVECLFEHAPRLASSTRYPTLLGGKREQMAHFRARVILPGPAAAAAPNIGRSCCRMAHPHGTDRVERQRQPQPTRNRALLAAPTPRRSGVRLRHRQGSGQCRSRDSQRRLMHRRISSACASMPLAMRRFTAVVMKLLPDHRCFFDPRGF